MYFKIYFRKRTKIHYTETFVKILILPRKD